MKNNTFISINVLFLPKRNEDKLLLSNKNKQAYFVLLSTYTIFA